MSDKFEWTDELVSAFFDEWHEKYYYLGFEDAVEKFKEENTAKDWEVLSVVDVRSGKIWVHEHWDFGHGFNGNNYQWVLDVKVGPAYAIYSVKRLSDGEVFSVGDEVEYVLRSSKRYIANIESFEISGSYMYAHGNPNSFCISLGDVSKVIKPKPLFVTEDGVELFDKNDKVWSVCPKGQWEIKNGELNAGYLANSIANYVGGGWRGWLHFSSQEKRDQYILMNKPLISLTEILLLWDGVTDGKQYSDAPLFLKMKEIAKQKLTK